MPFSIKNKQADQLLRELMKTTGENVTEAVVNSLRDRLQRVSGRSEPQSLFERLLQIVQRVDTLPDLDKRTADEILGYDETGVPN